MTKSPREMAASMIANLPEEPAKKASHPKPTGRGRPMTRSQ